MNGISMAELFAKDPRETTDEEFRQIIQKLREDRAKFVTEGARSIAAPRKGASAVAKLSNLGIDI